MRSLSNLVDLFVINNIMIQWSSGEYPHTVCNQSIIFFLHSRAVFRMQWGLFVRTRFNWHFYTGESLKRMFCGVECLILREGAGLEMACLRPSGHRMGYLRGKRNYRRGWLRSEVEMEKYLDLNWMLEQQNHIKMIDGSVRRIIRGRWLCMSAKR
jgi:hypothetical protein